MKKTWIFPVLFLFIFGLISAPASAAELRIHFIDVGEGDSILVETPKGKTVLIDAGNLISGFRVAQYLKENKLNKLDYLIFTHPHPDHIGGAFFILQMFKVDRVCDNGQDLEELSRSFDTYRWYIDLARKRRNYRVLKAGDKFLAGEASFKVLWPEGLPVSSDFNANSLVIMLEYKRFKALLTGDLTITGEKGLLKRDKVLKAEILKVGHHGSYSSSEEFLKAVSPQVSVISVNKDNLRGYPSEEVLKRLTAAASRIYRTDLNGDILVRVAEDGEFSITTAK